MTSYGRGRVVTTETSHKIISRVCLVQQATFGSDVQVYTTWKLPLFESDMGTSNNSCLDAKDIVNTTCRKRYASLAAVGHRSRTDTKRPTFLL